MQPILSVENLSVDYRQGLVWKPAVRGVSIAIESGEAVALVGESGSGKTTIARSILGLGPANARVSSGAIKIDGRDMARLSQRDLTSIRGSFVSLVPQDPAISLNPLRTVGSQLEECYELAGENLRPAEKRRKAISLLDHVGLANPEVVHGKYPHELSGGMNQRVLIAIAVSRKPRLIIADEPTSGLDATVQKRILDLIDTLRRETGTSVLLVTHDLAVAADRTDRVAIMAHGEILEAGKTRTVFEQPSHPYAQALVNASRIFTPSATMTGTSGEASENTPVVLDVANLTKDYLSASSGTNAFRAVDDVSFQVHEGATVSIVGESGSGKTTIASMVAGLLQPTSGKITFVDPHPEARGSSVGARAGAGAIQFVFQNPFRSLNPRLTVEQIIAEPLGVGVRLDRLAQRRRVLEMIERVSLPAAVVTKRPAELSGGQCQRVAIARALAARPGLVVLDEPVSALDVTVQEQILLLLGQLQKELGTSYLFISHDLRVVRRISRHVLVMSKGRIVEHGEPEAVFANPLDPFTRELIESIPGTQTKSAVA